jgi:hypothetical protein
MSTPSRQPVSVTADDVMFRRAFLSGPAEIYMVPGQAANCWANKFLSSFPLAFLGN